MLTRHQEESLIEILRLISQGEKRIRLIGGAGVGKTYLVSEILRRIRADKEATPNKYHNGLLYACAPTNKALSVLKSKIDIPIQFSTIHSAVKLSKYTDDLTGEVSFKQYSAFKDDFLNARIAVIDEVGMVTKDFLGYNTTKEDTEEERYIKGYLDNYAFPILYVGDDRQLNPVNEPFSQIWAKDYPTVRLTEIVRQEANNPIIELSNNIPLIFSKSPHLTSNNHGYIFSNAKHDIIEDLAEVNGTDEMKYLAYTNPEVDLTNSLVRTRRYGQPKKIEKGETIVFNSPYGAYYINQEVKVEDVAVITSYAQVPRRDTKFDRLCQPITATDSVKLKWYRINDNFNVLHEVSQNTHSQILSLIIENCNTKGWGHRAKDFWKDQFADIKYNHAITVHKSQGSTYKNTVINVGDLLKNHDPNERERLFYTAITRASNLVILNNVK